MGSRSRCTPRSLSVMSSKQCLCLRYHVSDERPRLSVFRFLRLSRFHPISSEELAFPHTSFITCTSDLACKSLSRSLFGRCLQVLVKFLLSSSSSSSYPLTITMVRAIVNDVVVAESSDTAFVEGSHYFPPESIKVVLSISDTT